MYKVYEADAKFIF